jgi:hypothetical protein
VVDRESDISPAVAVASRVPVTAARNLDLGRHNFEMPEALADGDDMAGLL